MNVKDSEIKDLLLEYKKISVYGHSPDSKKPSHYVPVFMQEHGWDIVGIYPRPHDQETFKIYKSLQEVPTQDRRFLNVFRASNKIPQLVDEVIAAGGVEVLWLQLGISHPEADARAESAGIRVVSDRCLIIEYGRVF